MNFFLKYFFFLKKNRTRRIADADDDLHDVKTVEVLKASLPDSNRQIDEILGWFETVRRPLYVFGRDINPRRKTLTILQVFQYLGLPFVYVSLKDRRAVGYVYEAILYQLALIADTGRFSNTTQFMHWSVFKKRVKKALARVRESHNHNSNTEVFVIIDHMEYLRKKNRKERKLLRQMLRHWWPNLVKWGLRMIYIREKPLVNPALVGYFLGVSFDDASAAGDEESRARASRNHSNLVRYYDNLILKLKVPNVAGQRFRYAIRRYGTTWTQHISDQEQEGTCLAYALTDVMIITYWVRRPDSRPPRLSPQTLIDTACPSVEKAIEVVTKKKKGLQTTKYQPLVQIKRPCHKYAENKARYCFKKMRGFTTTDAIQRAIIWNFSRWGHRYPMLGCCSMGAAADSETALETNSCRPPFHHYNYTPQADDQGHAVVITGLDMTSPDPEMHGVEIKNSWGANWADRGYTHVGFEFFDAIYLPVMDGDTDDDDDDDDDDEVGVVKDEKGMDWTHEEGDSEDNFRFNAQVLEDIDNETDEAESDEEEEEIHWDPDDYEDDLRVMTLNAPLS